LLNNFIIDKKYQSKKNKVYRLCTLPRIEEKKYFILKEYSNTERQEKEYLMLRELKKKGLGVPDIVFKSEEKLILEYIKGFTLLEILEIAEKENTKPSQFDNTIVYHAFILLFKWLTNFYRYSREITGNSIIFGDINLKNFIFSDHKIYGIDLENYKPGFKEEDGGRMIAYLVTYFPVFTDWKMKLSQDIFHLLVNEFQFKPSLLNKEYKKELKSINLRRKIFIPSVANDCFQI